MLSSIMEGSFAFANNPQTNILEFRRGGVQNLLNYAFNGISIKEAMERYPNRLSLLEHLRLGYGKVRKILISKMFAMWIIEMNKCYLF
jgi:hypothetical protein